MVKITKCLNDWNAIVEALGQGKQSIIRKKVTVDDILGTIDDDGTESSVELKRRLYE